jgi:hypothetical protein
MKLLIICIALLFIIQESDPMKEIKKNNMSVKWKIEKDIIHFEMQAPTEGWVAIGFNETASLTGTYLLMGRIRDGRAEVMEHYTDKPGSYRPISDYGISSRTKAITGTESGDFTRLKFSLPVAAASKYHKELLPGTKWTLLLAFSLADDFQHHSIMRTSLEIKL